MNMFVTVVSIIVTTVVYLCHLGHFVCLFISLFLLFVCLFEIGKKTTLTRLQLVLGCTVSSGRSLPQFLQLQLQLSLLLLHKLFAFPAGFGGFLVKFTLI